MDRTVQRPVKAKKLGFLLPVLLLVVLSLVFLGMRAVRWAREQEQTRLLTLVDREHPVEDDYNVEFTLLGDGQMVDSRCVDDLEEMLSACRAAGGRPVVAESFRTWGAQEKLYDDMLSALMHSGLSREEAEEHLTGKLEQPGCSEHQLGLAVVILEEGSELPADQQEGTETTRWLHENAWRYGFILRYPAHKTSITGIEYRPCHYRYVGRGAAEQIHSLDLTLEEYIQMFYS